MPYELSRDRHAQLHGLMEGDTVQLGDTDLWVRIERNLITHGEELLIGAGRNIRDGLGASPLAARESALDVLIHNCLILDPALGVLKADIGIKAGRIVGLGQAGNPDMQNGVDLIVDTQTAVIPGAGLIATPGAIDTHVHLLTADLLDLYGRMGYTTVIGGTPGFLFDVGVNPREVFDDFVAGSAAYPINLALLSRSSSREGVMMRALENGASGFKIHEDLGAFPAVIDAALKVSDAYDVQTIIHTDTINEAVSLQDTLDAIGGRTIHAYHVEGAGGGHAPDLLEIVGAPNVLPSSTNPTNPFTMGALNEHLDMILAVHLQNALIAEDLAFAQSRIRPTTMAAEDVLHDLGAIAMIGSDSQGMGHAGESARRAWQLADRMKRLAGETTEHDNERVLRYLAKYTLCPAIAHGLAAHIGSLQPGRLADIVLWSPKFFGVKPEVVVKCGFVAYAATGQPNGSTVICEPIRIRPSYGAMGRAPERLRRLFMARAGVDAARRENRWYRDQVLPVQNTRQLGKKDMPRNDRLPAVKVDPDSFAVTVDGQEITVPPATSVPLSRKYLLL